MPTEWIAARFGPPDRDSYPGVVMSPRGVRAARAALGCPDIERLLEAVSAPLTADRFLANIGDSFALTGLRFRPDPIAAERELCDGEQAAGASPRASP
jgi:arabinofuranosyltransferase